MLRNVGELKNPKLDILSVVLSTIAFGGLLYGFSSASTLGWGSAVVLGSIFAGIICLVLFVIRQERIEDPLLQLGTLKTPQFRVAAIIVTLINAACLVTNTLLPLFVADCTRGFCVRDGHGDASCCRSGDYHQSNFRRSF